ncbi:MAG: AMP-binding protein [Burkholderiaceae bacterium]|nr:AMP-binding protein [Burkholderiaceae bacterium]
MGDDRLSYAQLEAMANRLAHALIAIGVRPGDRVGLLSENSLQFVVIVLAAAKAGAFLVPYNFRYSAREACYVTRDAEPAVLFAGRGYQGIAIEAATAMPIAPRVVSIEGSGPGSLAELVTGRPDSAPALEVDPESAAMIIYTSGTTGFAKGVLFSHAAYIANHLAIAFEGDLRQSDVSMVALPLFHNGGLNGLLLPTLLVGATAVITAKGFEPAQQLESVARYRVTVTMWVPTMLAMIVNCEDASRYDVCSLTKIWYGASPISPPVLASARKLFGAGFYQFYGMCEIGMTAVLRPEDHVDRASCTGREMLCADMRVVDEHARTVAPGEVGEIVSRSRPLGMIGYWRNEHATREAMDHGWIRTGDMARDEGQGYFTIVDRKKDMIISGGENIYPKEIENVIAEHPAVSEVACFGIPDPKWGESVCAVIVLKPSRLEGVEEI